MIMEPADWYIEGCLKVSEADQKRFNEWTAHLPKREDSTPYHSQAHSIRCFEHALRIAGLLSGFRVLEIGFCLGHSAEIFYELGASSVASIEISFRPQTMEAINRVKLNHSNFALARPSEMDKLRGNEYDFGFIDGDHGFQAIRNDLYIMRERRVPWVLFDDFWPHWGDTQIVFKEQGITPVAILGTMALCHFP